MDNKFYAILDQDNLVINHISLPVDADISNIITNCYSERYSIMEYSGDPLSEDKSITNTPALLGLPPPIIALKRTLLITQKVLTLSIKSVWLILNTDCRRKLNKMISRIKHLSHETRQMRLSAYKASNLASLLKKFRKFVQIASNKNLPAFFLLWTTICSGTLSTLSRSCRLKLMHSRLNFKPSSPLHYSLSQTL